MTSPKIISAASVYDATVGISVEEQKRSADKSGSLPRRSAITAWPLKQTTCCYLPLANFVSLCVSTRCNGVHKVQLEEVEPIDYAI
jgi:hypothetical protein